MSITITDPALLELLARVNGAVDFTSPDGMIIGSFTTDGFGKLPPGVKSPFTDEQLIELRKQRNGRKLADILRDLEEQEKQ